MGLQFWRLVQDLASPWGQRGLVPTSSFPKAVSWRRNPELHPGLWSSKMAAENYKRGGESFQEDWGPKSEASRRTLHSTWGLGRGAERGRASGPLGEKKSLSIRGTGRSSGRTESRVPCLPWREGRQRCSATAGSHPLQWSWFYILQVTAVPL